MINWEMTVKVGVCYVALQRLRQTVVM